MLWETPESASHSASNGITGALPNGSALQMRFVACFPRSQCRSCLNRASVAREISRELRIPGSVAQDWRGGAAGRGAGAVCGDSRSGIRILPAREGSNAAHWTSSSCRGARTQRTPGDRGTGLSPFRGVPVEMAGSDFTDPSMRRPNRIGSRDRKLEARASWVAPPWRIEAPLM